MAEICNTKIENIFPYQRNSKKHPQKQVEQIANSIKEFGFNQAIVVDKDNVIIVGHGRYEAAKLLGLTEVPVLQVLISEKQSRAYRLADNKLNESEWDIDLVIDELQQLQVLEFDIDLTGFDLDELTNDELKNGNKFEIEKLYEIIVEVENENEQENVYNKLTKQGYKCRLSTL